MEPLGAPFLRACFVVMLGVGLGAGGCGEDRQQRSAHLAVEAVRLRPGQALTTTLTSDVAAAQPTTWSASGAGERLLVRLEPATWEAGRSAGEIVFAADWRAPAGDTTVTLTRDDGTTVDVVVTVLAPEIRVTVDRAIAPRRELPARRDGEARVASRLEGGGHGFDFARDELVVYGADEATLDALVRRLGGAIVERFTPPRELDVPGAAVVALPADRRAGPSDAASRLGSALWALEPGATALTVSDELGLDTLRIAAEETRDGARNGVTVVPSYVFEGAGDFLDGASLEAAADPGSGWTGDMYDVGYMRTDGPTPIGVGAAWQALDAAGRATPNSIGISIIDAGFSASNDFGVGDDCDEWDEPNVFGCGDSDCEWHGMTCALAAAGEADNHFGAAGTGAPVAWLRMEDTWYDPVSVSVTLTQLLAAGIPIVSMSFHVDIPIGTGWMFAPYDALTAALAQTMLLFAAAGNDGEDVDDETCIYDDWGCAETWWVSPCENIGVHCVGGIRGDSLGRAGGSNYGSDGNVHIFAPYQAWIGPSPDIAGIDVRLIAGTSISTPFVAGVAALVWAAKPSLSAGEVWNQLAGTALLSGDPDVSRVVNAAGAVRAALGDLPPRVEITAPASGGSYIRSELNGNVGQVTVHASVIDPNEGPDCCTVTWTTDEGETATGRSATLPLSAIGMHVITVRALDASGQASEDTITATLVESPPTAEILWPPSGATLIKGLTYALSGRGVDAGYAVAGLPCAGLQWTIDGATIGTGCTPSFIPGVLGSRILVLRAFDPGDMLEATAQVPITFAAPAAGTPPVVSIVSPLPNARIDGDPLPNLRGAAIDPDGLPITAWKWTLIDRNGGQHVVGTTQDANAVNLVAASPCPDAECNYTLRLEATSTHGTGKAEIPLIAVFIH